MDEAQLQRNEVNRMIQEAELYESQGLYDHAVLVYQNILSKEPTNRFAQAKIIQIRFNQQVRDTTETRALPPDELTPRLALDLGLAYMGMNMYAEALEEFARPVSAPPGLQKQLLRHSASCLIHLDRLEEAQGIMDALLFEIPLDPAERGDLAGETATLYLDLGLVAEARSLLERITPEVRELIPGAEHIWEEVLRAENVEGDTPIADSVTMARPGTIPPLTEASVASDEFAGKVPASETEEPVSAVSVPEAVAVPLRTKVDYSRDTKTWREGRSEQLATEWAELSVPDALDVGDSLILRIHLPTEEEERTVSVVSRVDRRTSDASTGHPVGVRVQFVSYLRDADEVLRGFIDDVIRDPSLLERAVPHARPGEMLRSLEAEVVRQMKADRHGGLPREKAPPPPPVPAKAAAAPGKKTVRIPAEDRPRIRFACECGQVNTIPGRHVGREAKCGNCAKVFTIPAVDTKPDRLGEQLIGRTVGGCRLLYRLGGGGMGGVFKAHHIPLDIPVALKILHAHLAEKDPVFIKRFIREARAAAKLQHPNIVGVLNVGYENGLHYLIMPYVGGGSAASLLARQGRLPLGQVLRIAVEITQALVLASEHNILHRDIKPANILFTSKGEATLADLGLAKSYLETDSAVTQTGIACGTPLYFSPEQAKGSPNIDLRSDIYSLGITLYHLLNGSPPFKGESAFVIFQKHVHEPLPPFDPFTPPIPGEMHKLLEKMTAKNPENRHKGPHELMEALEELIEELAQYDKTPQMPPKTKKGILARLGLSRSNA